jgi:hypothetical protein
MHDESPYLQALVEINSLPFSEKEWLLGNFDLYKSTLNWPDNLPPIGRSNLEKGMLIEKFNKLMMKFYQSLTMNWIMKIMY